MKKVILSTLIMVAMVSVSRAQKAPQQLKEDTVTIRIPLSKLNALQQVLVFAYQNLPTSAAKGSDIVASQQAMQAIYPFLTPVADKPKTTTKTK